MSQPSRAPARVRPHPGLRQDNETTTDRDCHTWDGQLSPYADSATGQPGWQVTTPSRPLAAAVAAGLAVRTAGGQYRARLGTPVLAVLVLDAGAGTLRCRLTARPCPGVLAVAKVTASLPAAAWPAHGNLSVRAVLITTRTGRVIRYLLPEFTPARKPEA
jgi:hypothetical protein